MSEEQVKYGAVACEHCGSFDVEPMREGHVKIAENVENRRETFQCKECGRQFSRIV